MRAEIYKSIRERLQQALHIDQSGNIHITDPDDKRTMEDLPEGSEPLIKHVALWNRNIEFIEQESAWERPAVFVEFQPIKWKTVQEGEEYRADSQLCLHIVGDWAEGDEDDPGNGMHLSEAIHAVLSGLEGEDFSGLDLVETDTNHDHEEIVESIDTYHYTGFRYLI